VNGKKLDWKVSIPHRKTKNTNVLSLEKISAGGFHPS